VESWIESLDKMRRRAPKVLIPSHTGAIVGESNVASRLTAYRDGIQWVRDQVVRGANEGLDIEQIVERTGLPPALQGESSLRELYGQIDWSVRAIYGNELGWFDGRPHRLYPHPKEDIAQRSIELMGGPTAVLAAADDARKRGDSSWSLHLLALLEDSQIQGETSRAAREAQEQLTIDTLRALGEKTANTNGRAYLLQSALEVSGGVVPAPTPSPNLELVDRMPISLFFDIMKTRIIPKKAAGVEESVRFTFSDSSEDWFLTLRNGILEVASGTPIPGSPAPVAVVSTDTRTWRRLSTQKISPIPTLASGDLSIKNLPAFMRFMGRFDQSL
jgi:alkyl sulfatase BDS1-like metallo-beta-lactamase superfamily hydrolase